MKNRNVKIKLKNICQIQQSLTLSTCSKQTIHTLLSLFQTWPKRGMYIFYNMYLRILGYNLSLNTLN